MEFEEEVYATEALSGELHSLPVSLEKLLLLQLKKRGEKKEYYLLSAGEGERPKQSTSFRK